MSLGLLVRQMWRGCFMNLMAKSHHDPCILSKSIAHFHFAELSELDGSAVSGKDDHDDAAEDVRNIEQCRKNQA